MKDYLQFDDTVLARYLHSKVIIGIGKDIFEHDIACLKLEIYFVIIIYVLGRVTRGEK